MISQQFIVIQSFFQDIYFVIIVFIYQFNSIKLWRFYSGYLLQQQSQLRMIRNIPLHLNKIRYKSIKCSPINLTIIKQNNCEKILKKIKTKD